MSRDGGVRRAQGHGASQFSGEIRMYTVVFPVAMYTGLHALTPSCQRAQCIHNSRLSVIGRHNPRVCSKRATMQARNTGVARLQCVPDTTMQRSNRMWTAGNMLQASNTSRPKPCGKRATRARRHGEAPRRAARCPSYVSSWAYVSRASSDIATSGCIRGYPATHASAVPESHASDAG